jgi:serine/threonine protein kinase
VLHRDISCNNIFLDDGLNGKLVDFAGSSTDGQEPLICYETSHEHPEIAGISTGSELFALGSTFYEIMTGSAFFQYALDTLSCPAMSTECERVFSSAKKPITPERNQLGEDIIEACECLKAWWTNSLIEQQFGPFKKQKQ